MARRRVFVNYIPIICVLTSILFFATPSPWGALENIFPLSSTLVLSCWLILRPKFLSPLTVFILGLLANLYSPYSLGTEAIIWLLIYLSIELLKSIIPEPGFIITWIWWIIIVCLRTGIMIAIAYVHFEVLTVDYRILSNIIFAIVDFPLFFIIFLFVDLKLFGSDIS